MNERAGRVGELVCLSLDSFALWTADSHRATAAFAIVTRSLIAFLYGFIWAAICATSCFARIARVFLLELLEKQRQNPEGPVRSCWWSRAKIVRLVSMLAERRDVALERSVSTS